MTVENLVRILWKVFEEIETSQKMTSLKGREKKKRHEWISSRKFFSES